MERYKYVNISHIPLEMECKFCNRIVFEPVRLICSNVFCKKCIEKYLKSSGKKLCPYHRQ